MNIKITHNWLLEFLDTNASVYDIQKYLSLSGPSIERVEKIDDDYVFDIEIISNRIDTASVVGIAQEATAILPIYGFKANFKFNPLTELKFEKQDSRFRGNDKLNEKNKIFSQKNLKLDIEVDKNLCSRFTAIIFDDVSLGPSPEFIQKRLTASGIKVINNIVDISNYLMLTLGQPVHMFDYDKISGSKMILRESKKEEKIKILDGREVSLPVGSIVIEDGEGDLTDLCGIMGGYKSAINKNTKRIIFFVQTYNKEKIRKTAMNTGIRTVAATYFEKGLDEERVEPTVVYGTHLIEKYTGGKIASKLIDIYPNPYQEKKLKINYFIFEKIIGTKIEKNKINKILENLGFKINDKGEEFEAVVPSYRKHDIFIPEDFVEEVARVWGYHNIGVNLSPPATVIQPKDFEQIFKYITKIKYFLKNLGLNEVINYSMISQEMIDQWNLEKNNHLKLANTISQEIEYMRLSLLPSLYKNIIDNTGKKDILKFFELAKVYYPKNNDLPEEKYKLSISVNTDYFDLKGIIESLIDELNINKIDFKKRINDEFYSLFFNENICATGLIDKKEIIYFGQSRLNEHVFFAEIDFETLVKNSKLLKTYIPINPYSVIKLDLTIDLDEKNSFSEIEKKCFEASKFLQKIELISQYQNKITLRFYFNDPTRNLTEEEGKRELEKIKLKFKV
ncbi:MAG: phenylalanine--tRNA ligase subunit beta [Patescibacteria group bacterium]|nr:phenylalanine--tRNA ligase subunit beta [Patescibacteria group bacterium]